MADITRSMLHDQIKTAIGRDSYKAKQECLEYISQYFCLEQSSTDILQGYLNKVMNQIEEDMKLSDKPDCLIVFESLGMKQYLVSSVGGKDKWSSNRCEAGLFFHTDAYALLKHYGLGYSIILAQKA